MTILSGLLGNKAALVVGGGGLGTSVLFIASDLVGRVTGQVLLGDGEASMCRDLGDTPPGGN